MANRDLNLILAALFELRLTCIENERTWADIGKVAEILGGDRSAMFFGATAPDRGRGDRTAVPPGWEATRMTREKVRQLSEQIALNEDERNLILCGLFELTIARLEDDALLGRSRSLAARLGGDPEAMFFGAA